MFAINIVSGCLNILHFFLFNISFNTRHVSLLSAFTLSNLFDIFTRKLRNDNALISSFFLIFDFYVMVCFVLTYPPLMLCVYLQTFEAVLSW